MATHDSDDTGISLQEDIASVQNDKAFHNVILVCSDNVEIGASDTVLAARSKPFKAMFFGGTPREGNRNKFRLTFKSNVMLAVIQFIHTGKISKNTPLALEVETRPEIPAKMTAENLRKELYQMMNHIDTSLICPHRFANLVASIDALSEAQQYAFWVPYLRTYPPGRCPPNHPSGHRGKPHAQWLALSADLVVYDDGAVVEYPMPAAGAVAGESAARMSQPIVLEEGDKVTVEFLIRSSGATLSNFPLDTFGFVGTSDKDQLLWKVIPRWTLQVNEGKVHLFNSNSATVNKYGRLFVEGDVISFYIDCRASTCSIAINGTIYGTAFTKLPAEVYFTATLFPQASYRLRMY
ncbi:hypothetical protein BC938DRAFT_480026 [Jimgerdemannia flammicorona]|uniref:BTB domain-containing protein n=1 Tax=Jimgerdemannia flammicorona TaxID=994334 RepID=A0A433QJJ2_9FUNG|nr:hypothetical protein BC938DRAFT_480026 [Jimgerdemannia flammicorona]